MYGESRLYNLFVLIAAARGRCCTLCPESLAYTIQCHWLILGTVSGQW